MPSPVVLFGINEIFILSKDQDINLLEWISLATRCQGDKETHPHPCLSAQLFFLQLDARCCQLQRKVASDGHSKHMSDTFYRWSKILKFWDFNINENLQAIPMLSFSREEVWNAMLKHKYYWFSSSVSGVSARWCRMPGTVLGTSPVLPC